MSPLSSRTTKRKRATKPKYNYRKKYTNKPNPVTYPRYAGSSGAEYKLRDRSVGLTQITTSGHFESPLTYIPTGVGNDSRVGNDLVLKSLNLRMTITTPDNNTNSMNRLLILIDKQANQTVPTLANLFPAGADKILSPFDNLMLKRFSIVYDKVFYLSSIMNQSKMISIYKKFNMPVHYASASTETPTNNNLLLIWFSNGTGETNQTGLIHVSRIRYTDA